MIAPLRGGRTNLTAMDIGAHRDPVKSFALLIAAVRNGEVEERIEPRHVLRVAYGPHDDVRHGMFFGAGLIHRAIGVLPQGRSRGVLGSTALTAGLLARIMVRKTDGILTPDKVQVMLDGEPQAGGEYILMISSTVRRLFAGMRPFWGEGPGGLRLTAISPEAEPYKRAALSILRGRPSPIVTEENGYTSRNVRRVELRLDCGFTVDGELIEPEAGRIINITADQGVRFVRA